jgi:hypothetical protein
MKKSSDTIGNQTHDLPVCSAVPQPLRHRVPLLSCVTGTIQVAEGSMLVNQGLYYHSTLHILRNYDVV